MIKLTNGSVQSAGGVGVPNGTLTLQLTADANVIASPGTVVSAIPVTFRFDGNGNLLGTCQIYSNAELTPTSQYQVTIRDQNGNKLSNGLLWQFNQATGSMVDIGTMVPTSAGVSFSFPFGQSVVPFSATPVFNATSFSGFQITLAGNVTSSSLIGGVAAQFITFKIVQDASGGRTFAWPSNVLNAGIPDQTPNAISVQTFYFDGTNAYPVGPMTVN